jgi:hypothetical protein
MIDFELIKNDDKYKHFTFLDKPVLFNELFKDKDYERVQINDANYYELDDEKKLFGFCGVFEWKNNELAPLDYDSYTEEMPVIAYKEFYSDGEKCLDILVESW